MNPGAMWGWIGGIAGGVIGLAGGIVGTYCSIRNTNGPLERAFMIRSAALCWIAVSLFLVLLFALPHPWRWFVWFPYGTLLPWGIVHGNRRQQAIRQREDRNHGPRPVAAGRDPGSTSASA